MYNYFLESLDLASDLEDALSKEGFYLDIDLHREMADITMKEVVNYARKLFSGGCFLQGLTEGNITLTEAEELYNMVKTYLDLSPPPKDGDDKKMDRRKSSQTSYKSMERSPTVSAKSTFAEERSYELPRGDNYLRVAAFNKSETNNIIVNRYDMGPAALEDIILMGILESAIDEPLYDQLRTKEQLGYLVYSSVVNNRGCLSISINVGATVICLLYDIIRT